MESKTTGMVVTGLLAALLCVAGPISIPLPFTPVPLSVVNLLLFFFLEIFGMKKTLGAYLTYLFLGFFGMPVFAKGQAGAASLLGPTGGFLIGFLFTILLSGALLERVREKKILSYAALVIGMAVSYLVGLGWFVIQMDVTMSQAFVLCVLPFLPGDLIKIAAAVIIGREIKKRIPY